MFMQVSMCVLCHIVHSGCLRPGQVKHPKFTEFSQAYVSIKKFCTVAHKHSIYINYKPNKSIVLCLFFNYDNIIHIPVHREYDSFSKLSIYAGLSFFYSHYATLLK